MLVTHVVLLEKY